MCIYGFDRKHFQLIIHMRAVFSNSCTVIPYRACTGLEQGFPCVLFLTGKTLFSLQGFPCEKKYTRKILFSLQGMGLQCEYRKSQSGGFHLHLLLFPFVYQRVNPKNPYSTKDFSTGPSKTSDCCNCCC